MARSPVKKAGGAAQLAGSVSWSVVPYTKGCRFDSQSGTCLGCRLDPGCVRVKAAGEGPFLLPTDRLGRKRGLSSTVSCISLTHTDRRLPAHAEPWGPQLTGPGPINMIHSDLALMGEDT